MPVGQAVVLSGVVERNRGNAKSQSDVSYGIGTGFRIINDVSLLVDYVEYVEEPDYKHTEIYLDMKGRF